MEINEESVLEAAPKQTATHASPKEIENKASSSLSMTSTDVTSLSKTQRKKLLKKQKWEEMKTTKRKLEKEKKKAKKLAMKNAGIVVSKKKTVSMADPDACQVRVALDLSFNSFMSEKDQRKVVKQVLWCYSANRHSPHPLQLYLTNFDAANKDLFQQFSPGYVNWDIHICKGNHLESFDREEIVYLSSESSNVLQELDEKKVYVIGGLVDHNSQKGLSFRLAEEADISHARLPIDEYVKLESRNILPINHVFEILLHFVEHSDWEKAFYQVIPKRKGVKTLEQSSPATEDEQYEKITQISERLSTDNDSRSNTTQPSSPREGECELTRVENT